MAINLTTLREEVSLQEALITFGGKAYPKFNTVVIMAGGAGSGKGFVQKNLLGVEGKSFDPDRIKELALRSKVIAKKVEEISGVEIKSLDLSRPKDVSTLHTAISTVLKIDKKSQDVALAAAMITNSDRKPNLIFDTTLKSFSKLANLSDALVAAGYDKKDINIVWVMNDIEIAKEQNQQRKRKVDSQILISTHTGAAATMKQIINMGDTLAKHMDGGIVIAFNKKGVDVSVKTSKGGGKYVAKANYFTVKQRGKAPTSVEGLDKEIRNKIKSYIPKTVEW